jgi:hypothetical protein
MKHVSYLIAGLLISLTANAKNLACESKAQSLARAVYMLDIPGTKVAKTSVVGEVDSGVHGVHKYSVRVDSGKYFQDYNVSVEENGSSSCTLYSIDLQ